MYMIYATRSQNGVHNNRSITRQILEGIIKHIAQQHKSKSGGTIGQHISDSDPGG